MDSSELRKKAKWHEDRAGAPKQNASLQKAAQMHYRAELQDRGVDTPNTPLVKTRKVAGKFVEPESKAGSGRPSPSDFAWR